MAQEDIHKFLLRLSKDHWLKMREIAYQENSTVNVLIVKAVEDFLENHKKEKGSV